MFLIMYLSFNICLNYFSSFNHCVCYWNWSFKIYSFYQFF